MKREARVRVGKASADELAIEHRAVYEINVRESAAVPVLVPPRGIGLVEGQPNSLSFDRDSGERFGVFAKTFDCFLRMDGFRRVDADEPDFFVRADDDCVTVDDSNNFPMLAGARWGFLKGR